MELWNRETSRILETVNFGTKQHQQIFETSEPTSSKICERLGTKQHQTSLRKWNFGTKKHQLWSQETPNIGEKRHFGTKNHQRFLKP